jgi:hypothetical protein
MAQQIVIFYRLTRYANMSNYQFLFTEDNLLVLVQSILFDQDFCLNLRNYMQANLKEEIKTFD